MEHHAGPEHQAQHKKALNTLQHKRRLPSVSSANHIRSDWVAKERWRDGEIIINGRHNIRGNKPWWKTNRKFFYSDAYRSGS